MENDVKRVGYKKDNNAIKFDWVALGIWISSLIVSLIPFYISFFNYLVLNNTIDIFFWKTNLVKGDVLWVFSTVLLFTLADSFFKKNDNEKLSMKILRIVGFVIFLFSELTWFLFNNLTIDTNQNWPMIISISFIAVILVIATPLRVAFIKEG